MENRQNTQWETFPVTLGGLKHIVLSFDHMLSSPECIMLLKMMVSVPPSANFSCAIFLLTGFPGLEWTHHWISLPIFMGYFVAIMGNATILHLV